MMHIADIMGIGFSISGALFFGILLGVMSRRKDAKEEVSDA